MQLTKKQVQYIENRLENDGIKYWDIRIEMLDHIVSDVENRLQQKESFKNAVQNSFVSLGWKENFNGSNFEEIIHQRTKDIGKKYRKLSREFIKSTITNPKNILLLTIFSLFLFLCKENTFLIKTIMALFLGGSIIILFFYIFKQLNFKSIHLSLTLNYSFLSLNIFNLAMFLPKVFFEIETFKNSTYLFTVLVFVIPLQIIGTSFYIKEYTKINNTYQKLVS